MEDDVEKSNEPLASIDDLATIFAWQDAVVARNRSAARAEFQLIERALVLEWSITVSLNQDPILGRRKAKPPEVAVPETICINLLHAAWSALVNATRLALYGAHVDALALTRGALEATYHAEYFRHCPHDAAEWDKAGSITDVLEVRKCLDAFEKNKRVRQSVAKKYAVDIGDSLDRFFTELSTYGTHSNPKTVGLRLSSPLSGVANLGFVSAGKIEATKLCASHVLHVLGYVLSEFRDGFGNYLDSSEILMAACDEFIRNLDTIRAASPRELSLLR